MRYGKLLVLLVLATLAMTGCYINDEAGPNEIAVHMDAGKIDSIEPLPGGKYSNWGFWADLMEVDISTQTFPVEDPEVLTSDNQAVSLRITIQARRKSDAESLTNLITKWNTLLSNEELVATITATAREGMKNGVRGYTLPQLLNDRNGLANDILSQLQLDASEYNAEIINVTIENVGPSPEYMAILSETANLKAETDREVQRQTLINQQAANDILQAQKNVDIANAQLLEAQAQTEVQIEIAKREGLKIAAANQAYLDNPAAYSLRKLELMQGMFGDGTVYFVPEGTDISMFFTPTGILPVPAQ